VFIAVQHPSGWRGLSTLTMGRPARAAGHMGEKRRAALPKIKAAPLTEIG
jgi:hypothetical protein